MDESLIDNAFVSNDGEYLSIRNEQNPPALHRWRPLSATEIEVLIAHRNTAQDWSTVLVTDPFNPDRVRNNTFSGLVRIGSTGERTLSYQAIQVPTGIYGSYIDSCDIEDGAAIHQASYLSHCIIGKNNLLFNVQELSTTEKATFGLGTAREGENGSAGNWIEVMNENGCRKILAFEGIRPADAALWTRYSDDAAIQKTMVKRTQATAETCQGRFSQTGENCVIVQTTSISDVNIGSHCIISGAIKLTNLTIHSSKAAPTFIGEGVIFKNGLIGFGCRITNQSIAENVVLSDHSSLNHNARVFHTLLGENSTISCCEVQHNLIFPCHEQHHNNSFLIASLLKGQSNIAAGATIGSNHNSRSNDNEIHAGRGFWPGLCSSFKHPSIFASFCLINKGDYPYELDIRLPFALVNNNTSLNQLEIMPAYWWLYNMYALKRNELKYVQRDKRIHQSQHIVFDFLAPDTIQEIRLGIALIDRCTESGTLSDCSMERLEHSNRPVVLLKAQEGRNAYNDMLLCYVASELLAYCETHQGVTLTTMHHELHGAKLETWINLGGQLIRESDVEAIRTDLLNGKLNTWEAVHDRYDELWAAYPLIKQKEAYLMACQYFNSNRIDSNSWKQLLEKALDIQAYINDQVIKSRQKDHDNTFRQLTFPNKQAMDTLLGSLDDNTLLQTVKQETADIKKRVHSVISLL